MSKKRWTLVVVGALVLALLVLGALRSVGQRKAQQAALQEQTARSAQMVVELASSDVFTLREQELTRGLPVSGTLRAANSAWVKARVPGELQGLTVREGDRVQAGQVVARIDPSEYEARLRQARLQADAARAQVDIAQRQYDNNQALVGKGFISQTALDTSLASLHAARASFEAAEAAADVARKSAADTVLKAPMDGFVSQRLSQPGERVSVDARIVEIVDLSRMEVEVALSAEDSTGVRIGQRAQLRIEGLQQAVEARVVRINPSTQAGSRSVLVYLQVQTAAGLRQGLFAQGMLGTQKLKALAVPLEAVRADKPAPYVQVVREGQVRHIPVTPGVRGHAGGRELVAVAGLPEGSVVLEGPVGPLREGTAVRYTSGTAPAGQ